MPRLLQEPRGPELSGVLRYWRPALRSLAAGPLPAATELAQLYLRAAGAALPARRSRTCRWLRLAGFDPAQLGGSVLESLARFYATFARLPQFDGDTLAGLVRFETSEHYEDAKARGRGVILVSGHIGNWELGACAAALLRDPISVVVRAYPDRAYDSYTARLRTVCGNRLIGERGAARQVLAALRRNETVGMLIDANVPPPGDLTVPFLGASVRASTALARLAFHSGAAVVPAFTLWSERERRYVVRHHPTFPLGGDAHEDTRRLYALLESVARRHPEQWFWIFDPCWETKSHP